MSLTIFKYDLATTDEQTIRLPEGARILAVGEQYAALKLWAVVVAGAEMCDRIIRITGTGHPPPEGEYIGTVICANGVLVWHVFDGGPVTQEVGTTDAK